MNNIGPLYMAPTDDGIPDDTGDSWEIAIIIGGLADTYISDVNKVERMTEAALAQGMPEDWSEYFQELAVDHVANEDDTQRFDYFWVWVDPYWQDRSAS